ncbi:hypothetical protein [Pedococcus sp. 2YAF34]|uniref:hypothetical protein n=1 Tax=Pedococcus sp. 2YAF34 TaxID=3233032 RepID=UPI003F97CF72
MSHRVVGVIGASGGLGTSTLAVALALRAAPLVGAVACVDLVLGAGGVDVTACVEHLPGLRWADLAGARGRIDGADLLVALPAEGPVRFLAAGSSRDAPAHGPVGGGLALPDPVVVEGVSALSGVCGLTVLDLGTSPRWASLCTDVVLVCGSSARQLADAGACAAGLAGSGEAVVRLVLRAARREQVGPEEVAAHLDLPLAGVLRDDPRTVSDADRGRPPGSRAGGAVSATADQVVLECGLVGVPA